ncbi:hypothetical protein BKA58DRAFT_174192 [Alternaria rosae]|uniref:uncharacterized protein n=1 Tax=Alternaria rosae TaxID=1187941 RepID=UPI001E8E9EDE|nr:uncharacterized protein BKA58DRAFT_174192 [Alternaria rosae]KAH6870308.1 hypothetical protein BKA58DRAFT_174192 [Alternaria rosae]
MDVQNRPTSIDMASIGLGSLPSPAPTYSSTFLSYNAPHTPQHANFGLAPKGGTSNNPYHQATHESPYSIPRYTKAASKEMEEAQVKPDYQDTNHPHFAQSSGPGFPTSLPARSRMPRKSILVPWVLFAIFFLTTLWFTSILAGARFLSIIHPTSPVSTVQEIHVYVNGEALQGSVSVTRTLALPTDSFTSTANTPSSTAPISEPIPDMGKDMDGLSTVLEGRTIAAPTGFIIKGRAP